MMDNDVVLFNRQVCIHFRFLPSFLPFAMLFCCEFGLSPFTLFQSSNSYSSIPHSLLNPPNHHSHLLHSRRCTRCRSCHTEPRSSPGARSASTSVPAPRTMRTSTVRSCWCGYGVCVCRVCLHPVQRGLRRYDTQ
jgi:hypothetical protein